MATNPYSPPHVDDLEQQDSPRRRRRRHRSRHQQPIAKWINAVLAYIVVIGLTLAFLYFVLQNT
jgi:hypothetical protein